MVLKTFSVFLRFSKLARLGFIQVPIAQKAVKTGEKPF
jgi:hypothetical protein